MHQQLLFSRRETPLSQVPQWEQVLWNGPALLKHICSFFWLSYAFWWFRSIVDLVKGSNDVFCVQQTCCCFQDKWSRKWAWVFPLTFLLWPASFSPLEQSPGPPWKEQTNKGKRYFSGNSGLLKLPWLYNWSFQRNATIPVCACVFLRSGKM